MIDFGLVTEGIIDQVVIENILYGYFDDPDLLIQPLQPDRDKDSYGGWEKVFEYCESQEFIEALGSCTYIIIHIDTDVSDNKNFDILKHEAGTGRELSVGELRDRVVAKFKEIIGKKCHNFQYEEYEEKFIFAIAIHSIECWLLPLYCDDPKKAAKIKGCDKQLTKCLKKKNSKIKIEKTLDYYEQISRKYSKPKELTQYYPKNPSLKIFIEEMQTRNITL
ncbi:hypothetical protein [Spirulina sp. 06S082]|uniref:hypothetical protein n=1 Tax=Spirulina sp. 06S082 TaxID=3110248 RepID=UPI002B21AED8|nr:hypothetical protein [Spirulina sp. 06S082]MEA5471630.1 hypothetical protein [Spirulina sp. 06S082]